MAKPVPTTEELHPSRLVLSAAVSAAEFSRKFLPSISNTPDLPAIDWGTIGQQAPQQLNTPAQLPQADAVVITWAEAEWAAMEHVFCSSTTGMPYTKRTTGSWPGWIKYDQDVPSALGYWAYFRSVQVGGGKLLLLKSNVHYATAQGEQYLETLVDRLIQKVNPKLILSIGTAGGARTTDPIGTVNVVNAAALYENNRPQTSWPKDTSSWVPQWNLIDKKFEKLLFPIPTTAADLKSIAQQFNTFYDSNYSLSRLNPDNLNAGASLPAINNLAKKGTPLLSTRSFVVANTSGNLSNFAVVEMDDAIIARTAAGKTLYGSIRNVSDPIQNADLPLNFQGYWGEAIYTAYGMYTSYNGALTAWAVLRDLFRNGPSPARVTSL